MKHGCLVLLIVLLAVAAAGCGNVNVWGEGRTALETSTMDAYLATQKASDDEAMPTWGKAYIEENFRQWRSFARSAHKDTNWGPKLPSEIAAQGGEVKP